MSHWAVCPRLYHPCPILCHHGRRCARAIALRNLGNSIVGGRGSCRAKTPFEAATCRAALQERRPPRPAHCETSNCPDAARGGRGRSRTSVASPGRQPRDGRISKEVRDVTRPWRSRTSYAAGSRRGILGTDFWELRESARIQFELLADVQPGLDVGDERQAVDGRLGPACDAVDRGALADGDLQRPFEALGGPVLQRR
jgi:hypothetical protein